MEHKNLFSKLDRLTKDIARLDEKTPTGPDEETDPRIRELLDEAEAITRVLDPIMREAARDNPAALAEWDSIMHMCDDLEEEEAGKEVSPPPQQKSDE